MQSAGLPSTLCRAWWANIFVLHPFIDAHVAGGMLLGQLGVALLFILQYALLLAAIAASPRRSRTRPRNGRRAPP
jgi:hypothetical protein